MPKRDKPEPIVAEVLEKYIELKAQSSERLTKYDENLKWFKGDKNTQYKDMRETWQPTVIANIIESNVRTIVAVLTDSNPIMRVQSFPLVSMYEGQEALEEQIKVFTENNDLVLNHLWRVNDMRKKLRKMVLDGCLTGLMCARIYWDQYAYGELGEIKIEPVHPKYIFFDKNIEELNIADGSCDYFMFVTSKPLSWFNYYWPGQKIKPSVDTENKPENMQVADYIECYKADFDWDSKKAVGDGKVETKKERKYPFGRQIIIGGDTKLSDEAIDYFPFAVEPISDQGQTLYGQDDVERQIEMQKDLNYKMDQLSTIMALSAYRQAIADDECGVEIDQLLDKFADKPGQVFRLEGGKNVQDFHNHFEILQSPTFQPELFQYVYTLLEFMEKVTGVTKLIQGLAAKTERQTGFEVGKMLETATIRLRERAAHVEDFIRAVGLNCMFLVSKYYKEPRPVWAVNAQTNELSMNTYTFPQAKSKITGKDEPIQWEYDVIVQPDSTLPIDLNSLADIAMRLKERQVISNKEVLKRLQLQHWEALPDQLPNAGGQAAPPPPPTGG